MYDKPIEAGHSAPDAEVTCSSSRKGAAPLPHFTTSRVDTQSTSPEIETWSPPSYANVTASSYASVAAQNNTECSSVISKAPRHNSSVFCVRDDCALARAGRQSDVVSILPRSHGASPNARRKPDVCDEHVNMDMFDPLGRRSRKRTDLQSTPAVSTELSSTHTSAAQYAATIPIAKSGRLSTVRLMPDASVAGRTKTSPDFGPKQPHRQQVNGENATEEIIDVRAEKPSKRRQRLARYSVQTCSGKTKSVQIKIYEKKPNCVPTAGKDKT